MKQYFRITMLWLAVAMIAPMMTSCDEFFGLIDNPVTPALRVYTETLVVGEGHSLKINATTQDHVMLTYASSDPSVAIVDAEGNVIGVSEGKTTITVTAQGDDDYYRNQIFGTNTHTVDVAVVKYDPTAIKLLADAQKEGALVSIIFNLDGTDYIAYFRLINGEYVLQNGPAAARGAAPAATRAAAPARSVTRTWHEEGGNNRIVFNDKGTVHMILTGHASLNGISISGSASGGGSASSSSSGSTTPGTATTQNSILMATWVDKETGNAIAQAQIDGATAAVTMVQAAAADANGHAVEMKKVEVNGEEVVDKTIMGEDPFIVDDNGGFASVNCMFNNKNIYMLVGDELNLEYTCTPANVKVSFSTENSDLITLDENTGFVKALAPGSAIVKLATSGDIDGWTYGYRICRITIVAPADIDALYAKLSSSLDLTSLLVSESINISGLVGDTPYLAEQISDVNAMYLTEKICKDKTLTKAILLYGGDAEKGYNFYVINGTDKNIFTLKPDAAIPSNWIGAKLFYVEIETASVGGGEY